MTDMVIIPDMLVQAQPAILLQQASSQQDAANFETNI